MSELTISIPIMESDKSASINDITFDVDEFSLEFNRQNIELLPKVIKKCDTDDITGLELFCYMQCESTDSHIRKQSRGVVFKGDELIMKGFPYTIEYNENENQKDK